MANFCSDKEKILERLTRYDGDITVEDVVGLDENEDNEKNLYTFFLHILLEQVCSEVEPNGTKRSLLFTEVHKRLSSMKFINDSVALEGLLPLRRELAGQFLKFVKQIHSEYVPDPSKNSITVDSVLGNTDFPPHLLLQFRYERNFEELEIIGKGGFGTVCKARDKVSNVICAVKKIIFKYKRDADYFKVIGEARSIAALNHPNVVSYNSAWVECLPLSGSQSDDSDSGSSSDSPSSVESELLSHCSKASYTSRNKENIMDYSFSNRSVSDSDASILFRDSSFNELNASPVSTAIESINQKIWNDSTNDSENKNKKPWNVKVMFCIQMEYCDCDLRLWLDRRAEGKDLPFQMGEMEILKHILNGVAHIHSKCIIHRDLKPQNIFYSKASNVLKIGDFGLAKLVDCTTDDGNSVSSNISANLGTIPYAAPEQRNQKSYDSKVDIYSLGIIFIEILYPLSTRMELYKAIDEIEKGHFPIEMEKKWPKHLNLVKNLVKKNPKDRPSAKEILNQLRILENPEINEVMELKVALIEKDQEIMKLKAQVQELQNIINKQKNESR